MTFEEFLDSSVFDESLTYIYIFEYDSKKRLILRAGGMAVDLVDVFGLWEVEEARINYIDNIVTFRLKEQTYDNS